MVLEITDIDSYKVLAQLIDEEMELYNQEDLTELMNASMILFTRTLLIASLKNLK